MEEIALYDAWITRIQLAIAKALAKREDRRYRNLKNKANGGLSLSQQDICTSCGRELESKLWGAKCSCGGPTVHIGYCRTGGCNNPIGYIIDDDYCGPEALVCSSCIAKARAKNV